MKRKSGIEKVIFQGQKSYKEGHWIWLQVGEESHTLYYEDILPFNLEAQK